jgi:hypothetical protein
VRLAVSGGAGGSWELRSFRPAAATPRCSLENFWPRVFPPRLNNHLLTSVWGESHDCHIEPDWLLLYNIDDNDLILARTGTHADPIG